jgi:hypothetical protein
MAQTQEQIAFIVNEWEQKYKPATLLSTDHNVAEIVSWVNRQGGEITIQKLVDAVHNLGDIDAGGRLQYHHAPKEVIVFKAPEKAARELRQEELVAKDIAGGYGKPTTEWDRPIERRTVQQKAAYVPAPHDETLPAVPSGCIAPSTKADIDNIPHELYRKTMTGPHGRFFTKRVSVILKRHQAALAAAAAQDE